MTTAFRWYIAEYRGLVLTTVIAALVLWAAYVSLGPSNSRRVQEAHNRLIADCRAKYAVARTIADSTRVDVWPNLVPFEGRKNPERNDLFNCGALRRRGEL